jgi:hypothetical protein
MSTGCVAKENAHMTKLKKYHQHLITFCQIMADDNLQAPPAAAKSARGAGYTRTEDYLVCKAFIAASEDPFVGTSQKGNDFQK